MGLDIYGKQTGHELSGSYSRLHQNARYLALVWCGMPETIGVNRLGTDMDGFSSYMHFPIFDTEFKNMDKFIWAIQLSGYYFTNLLIHSDCEGNYTKNGKNSVEYDDLCKGNSIKLLKELETLCNDKDLINHKSERVRNALIYTNKFKDLVKDEIENGCGTIIFS